MEENSITIGPELLEDVVSRTSNVMGVSTSGAISYKDFEVSWNAHSFAFVASAYSKCTMDLFSRFIKE